MAGNAGGGRLMREPRWEDETPREPDEERLGWAERIEVAASYTREERRAARATEHARRMIDRRPVAESPRRRRPTPRQRAAWARQGAILGEDRLRAIKAEHAALLREARERDDPTLPTGWARLPAGARAGTFSASVRQRRERLLWALLADVPRGCMFGACREPATRQHPRTRRWFCAAHRRGRAVA
jgi:hypothetical protein